MSFIESKTDDLKDKIYNLSKVLKIEIATGINCGFKCFYIPPKFRSKYWNESNYGGSF